MTAIKYWSWIFPILLQPPFVVLVYTFWVPSALSMSNRLRHWDTPVLSGSYEVLADNKSPHLLLSTHTFLPDQDVLTAHFLVQVLMQVQSRGERLERVDSLSSSSAINGALLNTKLGIITFKPLRAYGITIYLSFRGYKVIPKAPITSMCLPSSVTSFLQFILFLSVSYGFFWRNYVLSVPFTIPHIVGEVSVLYVFFLKAQIEALQCSNLESSTSCWGWHQGSRYKRATNLYCYTWPSYLQDEKQCKNLLFWWDDEKGFPRWKCSDIWRSCGGVSCSY